MSGRQRRGQNKNAFHSRRVSSHILSKFPIVWSSARITKVPACGIFPSLTNRILFRGHRKDKELRDAFYERSRKVPLLLAFRYPKGVESIWRVHLDAVLRGRGCAEGRLKWTGPRLRLIFPGQRSSVRDEFMRKEDRGETIFPATKTKVQSKSKTSACPSTFWGLPRLPITADLS